ncbi:MAG: EamA family transporter [Methylovirgula sp.]|uniref:EamA family transporter n=1 Tax=Methylovirgula sp. TaxID=1978224 RepID=UPI0030764463
MMQPAFSWQTWAGLSAVFAALTAILAKLGVENINSNFATLIRTIFILILAAIIVSVTRAWQAPSSISPRSFLFLALSALATGASWLCYFRALQLGQASKVAPVDKLSVVLVALFGVTFLGEKLSAMNWLGVIFVGAGAILLAFKF